MKRRQAEKIMRIYCGDGPILNWNRNTTTRVMRRYAASFARFCVGIMRFQEHLKRMGALDEDRQRHNCS